MTAARDEILRVLREVVAPLVRADGGTLYLVEVDDQQLRLHLAGRFSGCPGNTLAKRRVLEPAIAAVAPDLQLTLTSGTVVPAEAEELAPAAAQ